MTQPSRFLDGRVVLYAGDCRDVMRLLPEASVDCIVCDPPYLLNFMGKAFDKQHNEHEGANNGQKMQAWHLSWAVEAYRVLKPGGHCAAFSGARTYHRMACAIEDAGFEIRDQLMWVYGSGFPKSLDVSKAIDKAAGAEREVVGISPHAQSRSGGRDGTYKGREEYRLGSAADITAPSTDAAKQWAGFGTALKPSTEPICLARKPLSARKTITLTQEVLATWEARRCDHA